MIWKSKAQALASKNLSLVHLKTMRFLSFAPPKENEKRNVNGRA